MRPAVMITLVLFALTACPDKQEPPPPPEHISQETRQNLGKLLIDAARHGEAARVETLLEQGADIHARDANGETAMHAVFSRRNWRLDLGLLMRLQRQGADLSARDKRGQTPLHRAAERGRREALEFLLDKGVAPAATDLDDRTPLHLAAQSGSDEVVELLVARGADPNAGDKSKKTPLHLAEDENQKETARLLVSLGADILAEDSFGHAPARWMVRECFEELARLLRSRGQVTGPCSTHASLKDFTLLYASAEGDLQVVRHLLDEGADVNVTRSFHPALAVPGVTPLHAAACGGYLEVARLLMAAGARIDSKDKYGRYPLDWARWKRQGPMIDLLSRSAPKPK